MSHFKPNAAGIAQVIGPRGPFGRELERFGKAVQASARKKAPVGYSAPRREAPNGGTLRQGIKSSPVFYGPKGLVITVSAYRRRGKADVAYIIHEGHGPIHPKNKPLVFYTRSGKGGRSRQKVVIEPISEGPTQEDQSRIQAGLEPRGKGYVRAVGGHPFLTRALQEEAVEVSLRPGTGGGSPVWYKVTITRRGPYRNAAPGKLSYKTINR